MRIQCSVLPFKGLFETGVVPVFFLARQHGLASEGLRLLLSGCGGAVGAVARYEKLDPFTLSVT
jgi:hypothetical protein